jgi:hypothetical protein
MVQERRVSSGHRRTIINCAGVLFTLFGFAIASARQGVADTLNLECNTLFQVNQNDAVNKRITADSFQSYWLKIDWNNKSAAVYSAPDSSTIRETYVLNSDKKADTIDLQLGKPGETPRVAVPMQFMIKRSSGWFWKPEGTDINHPTKIDIIEVGVCGGPHRF